MPGVGLRRLTRLGWLALGLTSFLAACGEDGPPPPRVPSRIALASGDNQDAQVGVQLAQPLAFVVSDQQGPLSGIKVDFALSDATGFLSVTSATSDANGAVSVRWTVGGQLGNQTLTATVTGITPATARATVREGPPALLTPVSEASQFVVVGGTVPNPPVVKVTDAFGNPIANQTVTFADATDRSILTGATATSDAAGRASLTSWKIGRAAGSYTVQASTASGITANFVAFGIPSLLQIAAGDNQSANAGTLVTLLPTVRAFDDQNQPLPGVTVTYRVTGGGGRLLTGGAVQTGATGLATAPGWVLGTTAGANELTAETPGIPNLVFRATGIAAVPATVGILSGQGQTGFNGNFGSARPSVRITDAGGRPVAGTPVTFAVTAGGGSVSAATPTTDFDGVATLGAWRFGTGAQSLSATAGTLPPVAFSATVATPPASSYQITVRYLGPEPSASQKAAFDEAAAKWGSLILGDLSDVPFVPGDDMSFCGGQTLDETIDDLLIFARIDRIDGPGNVLGQAGACYIRDDNFLSVVGIMQFDVDDVTNLESSGRFKDVVLHEMGHVIGLGSLWNLKGLITGRATGDPFFNGASARMAFASAMATPTAFTGNTVPVENTGGGGTRDVHWRESTITNELMTGFLNTGSNPLSAITVASFRDEGYLVNDAGADQFSFGAALLAVSTPPQRLHTREWDAPIRTKDRAGRVVRSLDPRAGPFRR
ncbi:MAG: leishmanolysin-related zinc metalloendopeptidase [Gemmatimonadales bacterium]|nr:leishmanolysin-related zinc metalloendopeptidase [Gemmatimonadales bacterium]